MVITKKTAAGGIAALGGTAGAGYGIHSAIKDNRNPELLKRLELVKSKFNFDWDKSECWKALSVSDNNTNNYRAAIESCAKTNNFSDIARNLNLDVLSKKNKGNSWLFWWDKHKQDIEKVTGISFTGKSWNKEEGTGKDKRIVYELADEIADWCVQKKFSKSTTNKDWQDFLIACTKDGKIIIDIKENQGLLDYASLSEGSGSNVESIALWYVNRPTFFGRTTLAERNEQLGKDFWTNEDVIEGKIKAAGFKFKDVMTTECAAALKETFDSEKYKAAVKACVKSTNFETRAKELGLLIVHKDLCDTEATQWWSTQALTDESSKFSTSDGGKKFWKPEALVAEEIVETKKRIETAVTGLPANSSNWSADKSKIKTHCESASNNKNLADTFTNTDWHNYLKACTLNYLDSKDSVRGLLKKDFWTGLQLAS